MLLIYTEISTSQQRVKQAFGSQFLDVVDTKMTCFDQQLGFIGLYVLVLFLWFWVSCAWPAVLVGHGFQYQSVQNIKDSVVVVHNVATANDDEKYG